MANIFISYSSTDDEFVRDLSNDLETLGHKIWLDEWVIKVGESIPKEIQKGLDMVRYVIVVLSPNSVTSGWVEREWQTAYWDEIETNQIVVLPALIKDCEIPNLLKIKKYADFRSRYAIGFSKLTSAIIPADFEDLDETKNVKNSKEERVTKLIIDVQNKTKLLSQCIAEALSISRDFGDEDLEGFCKDELTGYQCNIEDIPSFRTLPLFVTAGELNPQYMGWGGSAANMFAYMKSHPDQFGLTNLVLKNPISAIEEIESQDKRKEFIHLTKNIEDVNPGYSGDVVFVHCYGEMASYVGVINAIRIELTRKLFKLLPTVEENNNHSL